MYKFKLLKPLSASSIIWALLVTAAVLLIASGASAQVNSTSLPTPPIPVIPANTNTPPPNPPVPPIPDAANTSSNQIPAPPTPPVSDPANVTTSSTPAPLTSSPISNTTNATALPGPDNAVIQTSSMVDPLINRTAELEERLSTIEERRLAIEAKREALQSASSTRQALLSETAQQRALDGMARIGSVLSASINKSQDLIARLRGQAEELTANGLPAVNVIATINQAEDRIKLAEQALRNMDINAKYAVTSDQPRADWTEVREQFDTVRQAIREAHLLLTSAIFEIRGLSAAPNPASLPEASSTLDQQ